MFADCNLVLVLKFEVWLDIKRYIVIWICLLSFPTSNLGLTVPQSPSHDCGFPTRNKNHFMSIIIFFVLFNNFTL